MTDTDTDSSIDGHLLIRDFARRHDLTTDDLADLLCVAKSTIRRYKTAPDAQMHRALNPVARTLIEWFDAHPETVDLPIARARPAMTNEQFADACTGLGLTDAEVGDLLGVTRQTVFRWRRDLPVPPTTAKLVAIYQTFGCPA